MLKSSRRNQKTEIDLGEGGDGPLKDGGNLINKHMLDFSLQPTQPDPTQPRPAGQTHLLPFLLHPHCFPSTSTSTSTTAPSPITIPTHSLSLGADRSGRTAQIDLLRSRPLPCRARIRAAAAFLGPGAVWRGVGKAWDEGAGRAEGAAGALFVEQAVRRRVGVAVDGAAPAVARRLPGLLRVRVPGLAALRGAGRVLGRRRQAEGHAVVVRGGQARGVGEGGAKGRRGEGGGGRRGGDGDAGAGAAGVRVRRAGAVRGGGGKHVREHAGGGRARHRGGAEAACAVQPAGVRAGRGDAAVARAEPRRAHGVPGREPVVRVPPGGAAPGAGGLRRGLHHHGPRVPGPAGGRARRPRRRVPPRPEPALLRLPPRHQRPPQPALRRPLGRHPRRRPARVHGVVAGADVGDIHGGGAGAGPEGGGRGDGRAGARLRAGGGAGVLQGVPVRGEPRGQDQHAVARPLRRPRRQRRPAGGLLRHRHRRAVDY